MIKFYYNLAPNPTKVALCLEEMGLPYELMPIDTRKGEQHTPQFLAINPKAKVPVVMTIGKSSEATLNRSAPPWPPRPPSSWPPTVSPRCSCPW